MRITLAIMTAAAAACGQRSQARPAPATAATTVRSECAEPRGAATDLRAYVVELVTSTDSGTSALREKLRLPRVRDASDVAFETDPAMCAKAVRALAVAQHDTASGAKEAFVLRVGTRAYVAWNYERVGEFFSYYVFDNDMNALSAFMS